MNGIDRDTFKSLEPAGQMLVLFDYAQSNHECSCDLQKKVEKIEKTIERKKKYDTTAASVMGFIGGFVAHFVGRLIGK